MSLILWTLAIAVLTAVACSLCGVYLVVKHESMVAEALSHAVLPGIIVAFIVFQDRSSPWLIISAGLSGLLMVSLVQWLEKTRLIAGDAALGIVFSALFSVGIIAASQNLSKQHFHADSIIDGNLATAALNTTAIGGLEIPKAFVAIAGVLGVLITFIALFYKEMKLTIFDAQLSQSFGFRPRLLHLAWLALVSMTTVCAFETAGSILVVALMIAPPAAALLLGQRLWQMLLISSVIGIFSSVSGFFAGYWLNISPTGPIATVAGIVFLLTVFAAPQMGVLAKWQRRSRQRQTLFEQLLLLRLKSDAPNGVDANDLQSSVAWTDQQYLGALKRCCQRGWVEVDGDQIMLSKSGMQVAVE